MIDFLFLGKTEFFGLLPDLVCKSLNGTKKNEEVTNLRQQIIDMQEDQMGFLSLAETNVEELEDAMNFLLEKVLFLVGDQETLDQFQDFFETHQLKVAGLIDVNAKPANNLSQINNAYKYLMLKLKSAEFISLGKDLNNLASKAIEETNKLKDVHQQLVPIRKIEAKGIDIYSKFAAGTSAGGEFFDYSVSDNTLTILLTSTSSYILTSYFLTYVSMVKGNSGKPDLEGFIGQVGAEVRNLGMNLNESSLFFLQIDLKRMLLSGYNFGSSILKSTTRPICTENSFPIDWNFSEKAYFEHQLTRGERVYLVSKGILQNAHKSGINVEDLIKPKQEVSMEEEFNEIFFQLKKNRSQKFLEHDATCVILEVSENAIFSV